MLCQGHSRTGSQRVHPAGSGPVEATGPACEWTACEEVEIPGVSGSQQDARSRDKCSVNGCRAHLYVTIKGFGEHAGWVLTCRSGFWLGDSVVPRVWVAASAVLTLGREAAVMAGRPLQAWWADAGVGPVTDVARISMVTGDLYWVTDMGFRSVTMGLNGTRRSATKPPVLPRSET